jgi:hypothetical protein
MTLVKPLLGYAALVTALAIPGLAAAQTCVKDSDCAPGQTCQTSVVTLPPTVACLDGDTCPSPQPAPPSMTCQPAPCLADADCIEGMVCRSQTSTLCSGGTEVAVKCDPNTVCESAPPSTAPVCTTNTTSKCVYKWQLPCNADADCGDGFACQPMMMGTCSGSGPVSGGSGGLALPPSDPTADGGTTTVCTTVVAYPGSCQSKVSVCNVDSDCPSTWKCRASEVPNPASSAPLLVDGGVSSTQPPTVTTITTATATSTTTSASTCQSPASNPPRTGGFTGSGTQTSQTTDNSPSTTNAGATTKGATTPPTTTRPAGSTDPQTTAMATGGCGLCPGALTDGPAATLGLFATLATLRLRRRRKN